MLTKNKSFTIFTITILLFISISNAQSQNNSTENSNKLDFQQEPLSNNLVFNDDNDTIPARPILSVKKTVNSTLLESYEWIMINITIKNVGNRTAYNLTVTDPLFDSWVYSTTNFTVQKYVIVEINATINYFYYMQPILEGNFTLESTKVTYNDLSGTEYLSISQRFNILVYEVEHIPIIEGSVWWKILLYCFLVLLTLGTIALLDFLYLRKFFRSKKKRPI
ncbi:MAG: hypothetical protein KAS95_04335, partial [Candidatus Heimdallarchaeota archaeon]|nr:hypothetical protein [Candidatus Heimdallarchaeota archaeon]